MSSTCDRNRWPATGWHWRNSSRHRTTTPARRAAAGGPASIARCRSPRLQRAQRSDRFLDPVHPDNFHNRGDVAGAPAQLKWSPSDALSSASAGRGRSNYDVPNRPRSRSRAGSAPASLPRVRLRCRGNTHGRRRPTRKCRRTRGIRPCASPAALAILRSTPTRIDRSRALACIAGVSRDARSAHREGGIRGTAPRRSMRFSVLRHRCRRRRTSGPE